MDTQHAVISKVILEGDLVPFIEARISRDFFPDSGHVRVWDMVMEHYRSYGKSPSPEVIHAAYPLYEFSEYPEPTRYYLHQLRQDRKKVILTNAIQNAASLFTAEEEGPDLGDELEAALRRGLSQASHEISQGRDTDFFLSQDRIVTKLFDRKANGNTLRGISTGMHGIDHLTGGLQPEQLITLVGTPKTGKSSLLLKMAYNAHRHGNSALFVTFEMSTDEQEDRLVSLIAGIGLTKVLSGTFDDLEAQRIQRTLAIRKDMAGFTISSDTANAITISGIQAKIAQYQPTIVIIDGMYLMDDEAGNDKGTPQALTSLTRGFKRLAQTTRLPIVVSTQAMLYRSKKGLKMDSIGYSSSFAQDSDVVFGVEPHEQLEHVSKFHVIASRSSPRGETYVRFDWSHGIIAELDEMEYEQMLNAAQPVTGSATKPVSGLQKAWGVGA